HAGAATVSPLPAGEFGIDRIGLQGGAVGKALDRRDEALPMRLPGGCVAQHEERIIVWGLNSGNGPGSTSRTPGHHRPLLSIQWAGLFSRDYFVREGVRFLGNG